MFSVILPGSQQDRRAKAATVLLDDGPGAVWVGTWNGLYRLEQKAGRWQMRPIDVGLQNDYSEERKRPVIRCFKVFITFGAHSA
jgi:hypothetical protein